MLRSRLSTGVQERGTAASYRQRTVHEAYGRVGAAAFYTLLNGADSPQQISLYVDVAADDSYTPKMISIRAGSHHGDLQEVSSAPLFA